MGESGAGRPATGGSAGRASRPATRARTTTTKAVAPPAAADPAPRKAPKATATATPAATARSATARKAAAGTAPVRPATPRARRPAPSPDEATVTSPLPARSSLEAVPVPPPIWTPPRPSGGNGRTHAGSVVADLWAEREQQARPAPRPPGQAPITPARRGDGRTGLIAAVVAVAVLLGGGVGVFMATQGVGLPSDKRFIAKADAVCSPANGPVLSVAKPTSYPELASAVATVATATDGQLAELRKMKLPGGAARGKATAAIDAMASTSQAAHSLGNAAGKKDDAATATATRLVSTQFGDATAKARAFGFKACVTGMQPGVDNLVGGSKALVKTGFVAKADNVCREGSRNIDAIPEPRADIRALARALDQVLLVATKMESDLNALPVPPGDETVVADMLAAQDKVLAKEAEMRDAAAGGDGSRVLAAGQEESVLGTAADAKLDAYGLGICGSNFGNF